MRESWEQYFLGLARQVARRSTCMRRQIGALAVRDKRILATGYNGAPAGIDHCRETGCLRDKIGVPSGERHELCLHGDTKVKLLDGTYPAIRELAQSKDCFWVYSCDLTSGQIVPALARFPRKTGKREGLVKVCLDNGSCILCTQGHRILKRDGTYCEASKLKTADSLMPMYYNFAINNGYESISNTIKIRTEGKATSWKNEFFGRTNSIRTHKLVYEYINGELQDGYITHHKNKILIDNRPENLSSMPRGRHSYHHNTITGIKIPKEKALLGLQRINEKRKNDPVERERFINKSKETMKKNWNNEDFRKKMTKEAKEKGRRTAQKTNSDPKIIKDRMQAKIISGISMLEFLSGTKLNIENYEEERKRHPVKKKNKEKGSTPPKMGTIKKWFGSFDEAIKKARGHNHKVVSVKPVPGEYDVYDLTVPLYENFAVDLGDNSCVFVHNCRATHAEQNVICQAARFGTPLSGAGIYIAGGTPCLMCAKMLINVGIHWIITDMEYPDANAMSFLKQVGIPVEIMDLDPGLPSPLKSYDVTSRRGDGKGGEWGG